MKVSGLSDQPNDDPEKEEEGRTEGHEEAVRIRADAETIRDYFDAEYYLEHNEDVRESEADPLLHFCEYGWHELRDPSPDFSTRYYLNANPEVRNAGINPLVHFVTIGEQQGLKGKLPDIKTLPETAKEAHISREISEAAPHFDAEFYLARYGDVVESGMNPLEHYMYYGWHEGRDPCAQFSTSFYLSANPDIRASGVNPFWHYIVAGRAEARAGVSPAMSPEATVLAPHFDIDFYLEQCRKLRETDDNPIEHYLREGWQNNLDPHPGFSTVWYLENNPDIRASGVNPFWHYIVAGRKEGRPAHPEGWDAADMDYGRAVEADVEAIRPYFDPEFYLYRNPDLVQADIDPVEHYCTYGWREGRDPCSSFSTRFYLESNPDIKRLNINPFRHYVTAGHEEGRLPRHPGGYRAERLRNTIPLEAEVRKWRLPRMPDRLLDPQDLNTRLSRALHPDRHMLILSVGHDNYRKVHGGVQLCEQREEALCASTGRLYLNLYPWQPLPRLAREAEDSDPIVSLLLEGEALGECRISDLIRTVSAVGAEYDDVHVVIHQMLGHLPERLADLVLAAGRDDCWLWAHDFFTICPSFTLQRNGVIYCGAPPVTSDACRLCRFGEERQSHIDRMKTFFERIRVHLLSPSRVTAETWQARSNLSAASVEIRPHIELEWRKRTSPLPQQDDDTITLAFLGTPAPHKGWQVFEDLFRTLRDTGRFRFLFLGAAKVPIAGVEHEKVHVTAETPTAMIDAVARHRVDLVLHWASWPETFSLSTYEAYAGGAYVITNEVSGNVAATVGALGRGAVLRDEDELAAFFSDGRAEETVRELRAERRKSEVVHHLSRMVHDAIDARSAAAAGGAT